MRKLTHQEIVERQEERMKNPRLPLVVVLNNVRSTYNVGSIFRTSDGLGLEKIWLCGITGHPPHPQILKTALGADERVAWEHHPDVYFVLDKMKKADYQIILLEQTDRSLALDEFKPRFPVCLVLGNEIEGVNDRLLALSDASLEIEMDGFKNSLNVAVAFGIAAYHIRQTMKIKSSP